jgi:predicted nucleotidyltransferase
MSETSAAVQGQVSFNHDPVRAAASAVGGDSSYRGAPQSDSNSNTRHKATAIAIAAFGSVARGDDGPESDIDLLVDFEPGASLVDEFHLQEELEQFLRTQVDVVSRGGLKPCDTQIRAEALAL